MADGEIELAFARPRRECPGAANEISVFRSYFAAAVCANDVSSETSSTRERDCFRKLARRDFYLMTHINKPRRDCFEEWNVRGNFAGGPKKHLGRKRGRAF